MNAVQIFKHIDILNNKVSNPDAGGVADDLVEDLVKQTEIVNHLTQDVTFNLFDGSKLVIGYVSSTGDRTDLTEDSFTFYGPDGWKQKLDFEEEQIIQRVIEHYELNEE